VLEVRADASIQIDLDYGQALILERVNGFFGYQAVSKLRVIAKPGLATKSAAHPSSAKPSAPSPAVREAAQKNAQEAVAHVADPKLRAALEQLGACVLAADRKRP
jgi:hypothetical protein